ncbi:hypothetical protein [Nannocystis pusilla]|uniref:Lipoprotein n=1 Tax=Nannocystis pusilla TaxID=889268 RepID=A0ABS7THT7_9BACT|nr:hypothetical protein [Nannocystis pusilla]MBZ5707773.1 hypothetical protein [Nannocystis pusilla]
MLRSTVITLVTAFAALAGCTAGGGATGRVQVFVEAEDTIPEGLQPGSGEENIVDGWAASYTKFLVVVGNFRAGRSADSSASLSDPAVYVVDLLNLPVGGFVLTEFADVEAVRWDRVGYDIPNAPADAEAAEGTSAADLEFMVTNGFSVYVEGAITKADGVSCVPGTDECVAATEVKFAWGLAAGTSFDDCAPEEGDAGFAVPSGGTAQIKPTIHGDHWFFTNITQGAEITERRAQWIADADLNHDGEATLDELRMVKAAAVFTPELGYSVTGAQIPVTTAYDYLEAQARTLGDFQGEGECPTRAAL